MGKMDMMAPTGEQKTEIIHEMMSNVRIELVPTETSVELRKWTMASLLAGVMRNMLASCISSTQNLFASCRKQVLKVVASCKTQPESWDNSLQVFDLIPLEPDTQSKSFVFGGIERATLRSLWQQL